MTPSDDGKIKPRNRLLPQMPAVTISALACRPFTSNDRPGRADSSNGLRSREGVDRNSPAAIAGLHGRGKMTSGRRIGRDRRWVNAPAQSLRDASAKRPARSGEGGDLIVAIDDRRVANDLDLGPANWNIAPAVRRLPSTSRIVRPTKDGSQQKLKVPIKLGDASKAVANADDDGDAHPSSSSAVSPPTTAIILDLTETYAIISAAGFWRSSHRSAMMAGLPSAPCRHVDALVRVILRE